MSWKVMKTFQYSRRDGIISAFPESLDKVIGLALALPFARPLASKKIQPHCHLFRRYPRDDPADRLRVSLTCVTYQAMDWVKAGRRQDLLRSQILFSEKSSFGFQKCCFAELPLARKSSGSDKPYRHRTDALLSAISQDALGWLFQRLLELGYKRAASVDVGDY